MNEMQKYAPSLICVKMNLLKVDLQIFTLKQKIGLGMYSSYPVTCLLVFIIFVLSVASKLLQATITLDGSRWKIFPYFDSFLSGEFIF